MLTLFLSAAAVAAQQPSYERVLIPLLLPGPVPGAYGSVWATQLTVRNEEDVPATIFQNLCVFECRPPIPTTACTRGTVTQPRSRFTGGLAPDEAPVNPAVFLHVERGRTVAMNLRLYERSRGVVESGVEIPIVREEDLRSDTTWLVDVPNRPAASRSHLRVYFVSAPSSSAEVRVRVYPGDSRNATADLVLRAIGSSDAGGVPPPGDEPCVGTPAYNILFLTPFLDATAESVRVRIDPLTPGLRYWPMISTTSNETQYVTLNTPQ